MFTCKDCVHYEACKDMYDGYSFDFDECDFAPDCIETGLFKNKADFVEVKRGEWINKSLGLYECSICGNYICGFDKNIKKTNYCDNCGADMRKEGADNG